MTAYNASAGASYLQHDTGALKLQTDQHGSIWFADGNRVPLDSTLDAEDFMRQLVIRDQLCLRVLGSAENAGLLVRAYKFCEEHGTRLEVASPRLCPQPERNLPAVVLFRMRQCYLPASLGGWRQMMAKDYSAYALAWSLQRSRQYDAAAAELLAAHPAWPDLSFLGGVSAEQCAMVLSYILDPRWFVDSAHPDRAANLRCYLGLHPGAQRSLAAGDLSDAQTVRYSRVLRAWQGDVAVSPADRENPAYFLWRIHAAAGGGLKGDLRASQKFVNYLRYIWLQALYADTRWSGKHQLFAPEMVFKRQDELDAYNRHCAERAQPA